MFFPEQQLRIYAYTQPTDMRKSFKGLRALVLKVLGEDPLSGALYVFINRRGNQVKVLYFDRTGFCIWTKRLERGCFVCTGPQAKIEMDVTTLKLMLEGIHLTDVKQRRRFHLAR